MILAAKVGIFLAAARMMSVTDTARESRFITAVIENKCGTTNTRRF